MKIGFQFVPKHPDRIKHAVLSFDMVMLDDRMQKGILCGDADLACTDFYIFDILLINLIAVFGQHHTAAVVEALKVRPSNCDVHAPNHDVAFLLGVDYRFVDTLHRRFKINDLAFTHTTRRRLADTEDFDRAIGTAFTDDHTNFRGSNLKANHQIAACHRVQPFLCRGTGNVLGLGVTLVDAFAGDGAVFAGWCTGIAFKMRGSTGGSIVSLMT